MLKTESLGNHEWYVKSGAVFQTEQCVERINLEAWNKMSPSHVFQMRATFFPQLLTGFSKDCYFTLYQATI